MSLIKYYGSTDQQKLIMRQKFAKSAMQGIISNPAIMSAICESTMESQDVGTVEKVAELAVAHADALIEELEKNTGD